MKPIALLVSILLAIGTLDLSAQDAAVVFQHDLSIGWISRTSDGGYLIREKNSGNVLRMNEDLEQVWSVSFGTGFRNFAAMPDGGVVGVRSVYLELGMDSVQYAIFVVRTNSSGQVLFTKLLRFPPMSTWDPNNPYEPYYYYGDALSIGPNGDIYLSMDGLSSLSGPTILKLTADGDPEWMVAMETWHMITSVVEPTADGGCYFTTVYPGNYGELNVYRISGNGTLDWEKTYSRHNASYMGEQHIRSGFNGNIVANTLDNKNLLWMEVTPSGDLLNYRMMAMIPALPINVTGAAFGLNQLANGLWVALHGANRSRVTLFDEDGTLIRSWKTPKTEVAGWDNNITWNGLNVRDHDFTVQGELYRSETTFNFSDFYPTLSTFSDTADLGDHCFMAVGDAVQTSIDPSQIGIVDSKYGVVSLPLPSVEDTVVTLAQGPEWVSSSLCAFATGLHPDPRRPPALQVLGNPINLGEPLVVELADVGTLVIRDAAGRLVARREAKAPGRLVLPITNLHAGYYLISLSTSPGEMLSTLPIVVQ